MHLCGAPSHHGNHTANMTTTTKLSTLRQTISLRRLPGTSIRTHVRTGSSGRVITMAPRKLHFTSLDLPLALDPNGRLVQTKKQKEGSEHSLYHLSYHSCYTVWTARGKALFFDEIALQLAGYKGSFSSGALCAAPASTTSNNKNTRGRCAL